MVFSLGCAGKITTIKTPKADTSKFKKAFIISAENSQYIEFKFGSILAGGAYLPPVNDDPAKTTKVKGKTAEVIKEELSKYGVASIIGEKGSTPEDIDVIVKYSDIWRWDLKEILDSLDILYIDPETNQIIAESHFKIGHTEYHDFPLPENEVPKMINELMTSQVKQ